MRKGGVHWGPPTAAGRPELQAKPSSRKARRWVPTHGHSKKGKSRSLGPENGPRDDTLSPHGFLGCAQASARGGRGVGAHAFDQAGRMPALRKGEKQIPRLVRHRKSGGGFPRMTAVRRERALRRRREKPQVLPPPAHVRATRAGDPALSGQNQPGRPELRVNPLFAEGGRWAPTHALSKKRKADPSARKTASR